jgi:cytidylate kinase
MVDIFSLLPDGLLQILNYEGGRMACTTGVVGQPKEGERGANSMVRLYKEKEALGLMKIDVFGSYLQSQAAFSEKPRKTPLAITISREVGAGGRTIAELVGQRLAATEKRPDAKPWAVFDANLAKQVLEDHKLPPDLERFVTEDARLPVEAIIEEVLRLHPSGWTLAQHTTKTILRLAGLGHVILVGRGASVITARLPNVFHVRLVAPLATRIRHTAEYYHLNEAEAAKFVREHDEGRRRYVRRYFNADIDDPTLYDVTLNTGRFGFARAAEVIAQLALQHHHAFAERKHSIVTIPSSGLSG